MFNNPRHFAQRAGHLKNELWRRAVKTSHTHCNSGSLSGCPCHCASRDLIFFQKLHFWCRSRVAVARVIKRVAHPWQQHFESVVHLCHTYQLRHSQKPAPPEAWAHSVVGDRCSVRSSTRPLPNPPQLCHKRRSGAGRSPHRARRILADECSFHGGTLGQPS